MTTEIETKIAAEHCKASDLLKIGDDTPAELIEALDAYFSTFAKPVRDESGKTRCINCGGSLDAFMHALGDGVAAVWRLAHGEAYCSGCKWPMRGMHYPKDKDGKEIISARNLFLSYHPDQVTRAEA